MSTRPEFAAYVCDQLREAGEISARKMFGEYGVYCDGKVIGLICVDQFFLKKTPAGAALLPGCPEAEPYPGAKPCLLIEDLDDPEQMGRVVRAVWEDLPVPKPKKPRKPKTDK